MTQRGGHPWGSRRRQASSVWSRVGRLDAPVMDAAARRIQLFSHYAGMLGEHATPQLSAPQIADPQLGHSPSLQPAAPRFPVLVYSRTEAGPGDGTQAG